MPILTPPPDSLDALTPREIVRRLDEFIVGQDDAKRAVAVALRNRWRRRQIEPEMRREVMPKNILMMGPTGVGKTEIARRLAELANAPFLKIEASKFTEVGYHGRDVESMIRDLAKIAVNGVQAEALERVAQPAREAAEERVLDLLLPRADFLPREGEDAGEADARRERTREKLRQRLRTGTMDERMVEIQSTAAPPVAGVFGSVGGEDMGLEMQEMLQQMLPGKRRERRVTVPQALQILQQEEAEKLVDPEAVNREGVSRAEESGIVFIDEIDKTAGSGRSEGPDVSREGVQRDLLPIVEGTSVATRFGIVKTDHILFIAAGAFHGKKPADLIPELQGRFPIRVELTSLTEADYARILTHPRNALTKQYELLLGAEGIRLEFTVDALGLMAELTARVNRTTQDIGARRLHTVMEKLLEELSFEAPDRSGESVRVTPEMVRERLKGIVDDEDLSRFIL